MSPILSTEQDKFTILFNPGVGIFISEYGLWLLNVVLFPLLVHFTGHEYLLLMRTLINILVIIQLYSDFCS